MTLLLRLLVLGGVLAVLPRAALAVTSIADVVDHRDDFANQEVTVVGTVEAPSLGYRGESFYTLAEDARRINVVSRSAAPAVGKRLHVTAKVLRRPPDAEFDFPPVLQEKTREPAD